MARKNKYENYDPWELFREKLEHDEKILHFGFAHDASGALAGCMMFVILPMPILFLVVSIIFKLYLMTVIIGVLLLLTGGALLKMKLNSEPFAPTVITDKRLLSIVGGEYQSVYYDDIHELRFDRTRGDITVVAFSTARLIECMKRTRTHVHNHTNPSPYLHLLYSFTENQEEAYKILNEAASPFIYGKN